MIARFRKPSFSLTRFLASVFRFSNLSFNSAFRLVDLVYFPVVGIFFWGFFSLSWKATAGMGGFIAVILAYQVVYGFASQLQQSFSLLTLEDIWHDSLKQSVLFSPLSFPEYVASKFTVALMRALVTLALTSAVVVLLFNYTVLSSRIIDFSIILLAVMVAAFAMGLFVDSTIFLFGRDLGFLAWAILELFMMLSCPFFSVTVFPAFMQPVARAAPFFWAFQAMKDVAVGGPLSASVVFWAFMVPLLYLVAAVPVYVLTIRTVKRNGRLTWS